MCAKDLRFRMFALSVTLRLAQTLSAQASLPDHLTAFHPVARRIQAASVHKYFVYLDTEDKAKIAITHVGPLNVTTYSPAGELLDRPKAPGPDPQEDFVFDITGTAPGTYRIEVATPKGQAAKYEIYLDGLSTRSERFSVQTSADLERRDQEVTEDEFRVLRRAGEFLSSASVWNRQDPRVCLPDEKKRSLFCAIERSQMELFGEDRPRSVAWQEVRFAIDDVTGGQKFEHRLKDFNNSRSTNFDDVKRVLTIAAHRVRVRLDAQKSATHQ
jgi:hypothetical protein